MQLDSTPHSYLAKASLAEACAEKNSWENSISGSPTVWWFRMTKLRHGPATRGGDSWEKRRLGALGIENIDLVPGNFHYQGEKP